MSLCLWRIAHRPYRVFNPLDCHREIVPNCGQSATVSRQRIVRWKRNRPVAPQSVNVLLDRNESMRLKGIVPSRKSGSSFFVELFVAPSNHGKSIFVKAKPDM